MINWKRNRSRAVLSDAKSGVLRGKAKNEIDRTKLRIKRDYETIQGDRVEGQVLQHGEQTWGKLGQPTRKKGEPKKKRKKHEVQATKVKKKTAEGGMG